MKTASMHAAKTNLSALVRDALDGEEVIITSRGKPLVKLVPVDPPKRRDIFGVARNLPGWKEMSDEEVDRKVAAALAPLSDKELEAEGWL
jgi:prevent-host-death family protein